MNPTLHRYITCWPVSFVIRNLSVRWGGGGGGRRREGARATSAAYFVKLLYLIVIFAFLLSCSLLISKSVIRKTVISVWHFKINKPCAAGGAAGKYTAKVAVLMTYSMQPFIADFAIGLSFVTGDESQHFTVIQSGVSTFEF